MAARSTTPKAPPPSRGAGRRASYARPTSGSRSRGRRRPLVPDRRRVARRAGPRADASGRTTRSTRRRRPRPEQRDEAGDGVAARRPARGGEGRAGGGDASEARGDTGAAAATRDGGRRRTRRRPARARREPARSPRRAPGSTSSRTTIRMPPVPRGARSTALERSASTTPTGIVRRDVLGRQPAVAARLVGRDARGARSATTLEPAAPRHGGEGGAARARCARCAAPTTTRSPPMPAFVAARVLEAVLEVVARREKADGRRPRPAGLAAVERPGARDGADDMPRRLIVTAAGRHRALSRRDRPRVSGRAPRAP